MKNQWVRFGDCALSRDGRLTMPGGERRLTPRLTAVLERLALTRGETVRRDELLDTYWGEGLGSQQVLAKTIYELRTVLSARSSVSIDSVYGRGYRLRVNNTPASRYKAAELSHAMCDEATQRVRNLRAGSLRGALQIYETAISVDPTNTHARVGYANALIHMMATGQERSATGWPALREVLESAIGHDWERDACMAHLGFGFAVFERDLGRAGELLNTALLENPGAYEVNDRAGRFLLHCGMARQATARLRVASEANPFAIRTTGLLAYALGCVGEIESALMQVDAMLRRDPANALAQMYGGWVEGVWGDAAKACVLARKAHESVPRAATVAAIHALALARAGERDVARRILESLGDSARYPSRGNSFSSVAWQVLDEPGAALEALRAGVDQCDVWVGLMINDPLNASLNQEREFLELHRRAFRNDAAEVRLPKVAA